MKTKLIPALSAALILAACAGEPDVPKGPVSEARTTAFKAMMPNFSSMGKMVNGDEVYNVETFKTAAAAFAQESKKPFEHFHKDEQGDGDTLPVTWENPDAFKAEQEKFHAAVDELNEQAQTGNLEAVKTAYNNVGASCKSCHDTFRRPK
ncbi:c-type cytochrome [Neisseria musculi]|uniref:Cytochrome C' family protein n=1 Tax=Neisseria musculi TaxID=1815583 RepID=A0A7H1MAE2_9NEIS|nr:cytochrome c [Neisseria musculi]QNT58607.1 cytochrome C' family protein [Neisseria musculi]